MATKKTTKKTTKTVAVNTYDWQKTAWKFIQQFLLVAIVAGLTWLVSEGLPELSLDYPEYAVLLSLISAVVIAVINYLKHYDDIEYVEVEE